MFVFVTATRQMLITLRYTIDTDSDVLDETALAEDHRDDGWSKGSRVLEEI